MPGDPEKRNGHVQASCQGIFHGFREKGKMRGTFAAVEERIPYLKALGVTTVELMPVYEFEEIEIPKKQKLPGYIPQGDIPEKEAGSGTDKKKIKSQLLGGIQRILFCSESLLWL